MRYTDLIAILTLAAKLWRCDSQSEYTKSGHIAAVLRAFGVTVSVDPLIDNKIQLPVGQFTSTGAHVADKFQ